MKIRSIFIVALFLTMWAAVFVPNEVQKVYAQQNLYTPTVYTAGTAVVGWTAGTLNNGGHAVTVTASTGSVTTSKSDCSAPAYANCNFVYANSSGTVAVSTSVAVANANGNSLMAYVETNGTTVSNIVYPNQASTPFQVKIVQNCGTTVTCANTSAGPGLIEVFGSAALSSASPSTASLVQLPFTSSTSYVCTATPVGTSAAIATGGLAINQTSGAAATVTGPNTVTTTFNYRCTGI